MELRINQALHIEKLPHEDPEISVFQVDDFLANPETLMDFAFEHAYFGAVGNDRTAYPGIRDRLPKPYERVLSRLLELVYGESSPIIHRCMLSLTTLTPDTLRLAQKMPHVDTFDDEQFAAVHYLCDPPHGGTAIYRYRPEGQVRLRAEQRHLLDTMLAGIKNSPDEHNGYLTGDTSLFKQELTVAARFNRLILYPSNLLHCAILNNSRSLSPNPHTGRLTVASFFRLDSGSRQTQEGGRSPLGGGN